MDEGPANRSWSPTPPCATGISPCWPPACAPMTSRASLRPMPTACRSFCRWNAGAAPPSTWRCASWARIRGSGWRGCARRCPIFSPRCCCAAPMAWATPIIPTMWSRNSSAAPPTAGMDLFRIFDCLNWVENMRVAIDAVREAGKLAEGAVCYTGDIFDPARSKYDLAYYIGMAKELEKAGCHILAIKDMAGLLKPAQARVLIARLEERDRPADPSAHPRYVRHRRRHHPGGGGCGRRCGGRARWTRCRAPPRSPAWARSSRPCAIPRAIRASIPKRSARSASIGKRCAPSMPPSKATSRRAPRKSISTRCRAASSPTSRNRRGRWGWRRAGMKWPRPIAPPTICSATSSKSRRPPRWWATWR